MFCPFALLYALAGQPFPLLILFLCELFGTDVSNFVVVVCSTEPHSYYEEDATTLPPPTPATYTPPPSSSTTTRNSHTTRNYFNNNQFHNFNHIKSSSSTPAPYSPLASTTFNPFSIYLSSLPPVYRTTTTTTTTTTPEPPHYDYHEENNNNNYDPPATHDPYYHHYSTLEPTTASTTEKPATKINPFYFGLYHKQNQQHTEYSTRSYHTTTVAPTIGTTRKPFYHNNYHLHKQQNGAGAAADYQEPSSSSTRNPIFDVYLKRKAATTKSPYDFGNFGVFNKGTTRNPRFSQNYFGANSQLNPVAANSNAGHIEQQQH